jgi:hypothetical protein
LAVFCHRWRRLFHLWQIAAKRGRIVLKELIFSAIVLPFVPRRQPGDNWAHRRPDVIDVAPMPPPMTVDSLTAVRAFCGEMMEFCAGDTVRLHHVFNSYHQLAPNRGWPGVSTKALSMHLVALGCRRRQLDLRRAGEGRPTAIEFPLEFCPVKRRRVRK